MTQTQKSQILSLRTEGMQYKQIAEQTGLSLASVKMFFSRQRHQPRRCPYCNKPLPKNAHGKKRFCSDKCRIYWWRKTRATA